MAETFYYESPEAQAIVEKIIADEPEFARLREETVLVVGCEPAPKTKGKIRYGLCEVVSGRNALLYWQGQGSNISTPFFRLVFSMDLWNELDAAGQAWLVRHELRHAIYKKKAAIRPHDFELFYEDLKDPAMDQVCQVWQAVQEAQLELELPLVEENH